MDTTAHNEPYPEAEEEMTAEDQLDYELHSFVVLASNLAACSLLPEKLRAKIGEAVRAAKGCTVCKMPLGALHALDCEVTRYEWRHHGLRREVMSFDLALYAPHEEQPDTVRRF